MSLRPDHRTRTSVSGSVTGSFSRSSPLTAPKSAVFAPIPSAREMRTTPVQPFDCTSRRAAWRRSFSIGGLPAAFVAHQRGECPPLFEVAELFGGVDVGGARGAGHRMRGSDREQDVRGFEAAL